MIGYVRRWRAVLAVIACAAALLAVLGPGYAGYDASWALVWGHEIASGALPSYEGAVAPTPHPLANAVTAMLSPLADGGEQALIGLTFLSFAALLAGAGVLVARLARWPAGVIAALVLGSCALLDREVAFASFDLPFLALVVWAAAIEALESRRRTAVLALLLLAGLLRPEAWLLSLLYLVWLARARPRGDLRVQAMLAVAGPLIWALTDFVVTGDPLHSLTGTRDLAAELDRPTGLSTALDALPSSLASVVGAPALAAGIVGLAGGLLAAPRRMAVPLTIVCAGLATFLFLGLAGLPVLVRYLLLPVCMLAVTAGIGLTLPWLGAGGRLPRAAATAISVVVGLLLVAAVPRAIDQFRSAREFTHARGAVSRDLRAVTKERAFKAAALRCSTIRVPDFRTRPLLLVDGSVDPGRVVVGNLADGERGLLLTYASQDARRVFNLGAPGEARLQAIPVNARLVARNRSWLAAAVC